MANKITNITELLEAIAKSQSNTCKIQITIGGTSDTGMAMHDCITITSAPPRVFRVISLVDPTKVSIAHGGVHIQF